MPPVHDAPHFCKSQNISIRKHTETGPAENTLKQGQLEPYVIGGTTYSHTQKLQLQSSEMMAEDKNRNFKATCSFITQLHYPADGHFQI